MQASTIQEIKAFYDAYFTPEKVREVNAAYEKTIKEMQAQSSKPGATIAFGDYYAAPIKLDPLPAAQPTFRYSSGLFTPF